MLTVILLEIAAHSSDAACSMPARKLVGAAVAAASKIRSKVMPPFVTTTVEVEPVWALWAWTASLESAGVGTTGVAGARLPTSWPAGGWKFWKSGAGALVEVRVRHLERLTIVGSNDVLAPGLLSGDQLTVSMAGMGVVRLDQLKVGQLNFEISGAGEGQLNGQVDRLRLSVSGKGKIGAEQLRTGTADVSISGVGNASLWAVDKLHVRISGAGHVDYWGDPAVSKSISGFGSVDPRGAK